MNRSNNFPFELNGRVDPQLYQRLIQLFERVSVLEQRSPQTEQQVRGSVREELLAIGLIGAQGQPLIGLNTTDPLLSQFAAAPGTGTVTSINGAGGTNISVTGGPITSSGTLTVSISVTPTFTTVDASTSYKIGGTKVVGAQGAVVADAAGGVTIDAEARTAINTLLARLRTHGLIAT